jgi:uncharacterized protein YggU (UPF0235/DUF167 family)
MKINVRAKTNSRKERVTLMDDGSYLVRVNAPPIEGRANERICELLADFFGVSKSQV